MEYLNFSEISQEIPFIKVLDWLNVPYQVKNGEYRGKFGEILFIVNVAKNNFFCPKDELLKGGVINFVAAFKNCDLREAATELKNQFLTLPKPPQRELPNLELHYCKWLKDHNINEATASKFEVGLVKQKSIISGRVAFKIYDHEGRHTGYIGFHPEKQDWFFPKGFKRPLYGFYLYKGNESIILTSDLLKCLILSQEGLNCCCLLGKSMTEEQEKALKTFSSITLIHSEPDNIVKRLIPFVFLKVQNSVE